MIYLDNGATSFPKPACVKKAMIDALTRCGNPGRGGHAAAMAASEVLFDCRETAARMFSCETEQVVFTANCTHGLNIALRTIVQPGARVAISGFEHNAVTRVLHALGAHTIVAGRKLFDHEECLTQFEQALRSGVDAAVFTHVSNVFGYILPLERMAALCRLYRVPFVVDAAQSAGVVPIDFSALGADFVAMPGHKGLLGPQGTGILLCARTPQPLLFGGTGSNSVQQEMPDFLPDRVETGTANVAGIAGLCAGMRYVNQIGVDEIFRREHRQVLRCARGLHERGYRVFTGEHQAGTLSFLASDECEQTAQRLAQRGIAVRAGLHCAPLAHRSAGTLDTGTVRLSFGHDASDAQTDAFLQKIM